jgi:hypothetical protein
MAEDSDKNRKTLIRGGVGVPLDATPPLLPRQRHNLILPLSVSDGSRATSESTVTREREASGRYYEHTTRKRGDDLPTIGAPVYDVKRLTRPTNTPNRGLLEVLGAPDRGFAGELELDNSPDEIQLQFG